MNECLVAVALSISKTYVLLKYSAYALPWKMGHTCHNLNVKKTEIWAVKMSEVKRHHHAAPELQHCPHLLRIPSQSGLTGKRNTTSCVLYVISPGHILFHFWCKFLFRWRGKYKQNGAWSLRDVVIYQTGRVWWKTLSSCIMDMSSCLTCFFKKADSCKSPKFMDAQY